MKNKAKKLKIQVVDDGKYINIPAIPFWLINFIISIFFGLGKIALKFHDENDEVYGILKNISSKDIKSIIKELKQCDPFDLVDIEDSGNTKIKISIL